MILTKFNKERILSSSEQWMIPNTYLGSLILYLTNGIPPGSFLRAILMNDFHLAISHCSLSNAVVDLKNISDWICISFPPESHGSQENVDNWIAMSSKERRKILENHKIILTEKQEVVEALKMKGEVW